MLSPSTREQVRGFFLVLLGLAMWSAIAFFVLNGLSVIIRRLVWWYIG